MTFGAEALRLLVRDVADHGLGVLAGAGVSFAPPACAPLFRPLRDGLLQRLSDSLSDTLLQLTGTA